MHKGRLVMSIVITVLLVILLGIAVYNMLLGNEMILFSLPSILVIVMALSLNIGYNFGPFLLQRQKTDLSVTGIHALAHVQGYKVERMWQDKTVNVRVNAAVMTPNGEDKCVNVLMRLHVQALAKLEPGAPLRVIYDPQTLKAVADDNTY